MRTFTIAFVLAVAGAGPAVASQTRDVNLLRAFARQMSKVRHATAIPVLLPDTLSLGGTYRLYATGAATRRSWELSLAAAPRCGGANACFVASFEGARDEKLPWKPNATLRDGSRAAYKPITCGASCSPASFWFRQGNVVYSWQVKDLAGSNPKATFVRLANQAIAAGPR